MRQSAKAAGDPAVQESCGPWTINWRPTGFCVRSAEGMGTSFIFSRVILPVEIVTAPPQNTGHAVLNTDPFSRVEILKGTPAQELERFKQRVSFEVLAAVKTSPFGCSDCAREAGMIGSSWTGAVCPGCREYYCRSSRCLRRLTVLILRNGTAICKYCGTVNDRRVAPPKPAAPR